MGIVQGNSTSYKVFKICNYTFLTLLGIVFVLPYVLIVLASITANSAFLAHGYSLFPKAFSLEAYKVVFSPGSEVYTALRNSIIITVVGTFLHVSVTTMAAYTLSKLKLVGRKVLMGLVIFSMLFSGGLIPSYILITNLGLKNSFLAIWLPGMLAPWNCILIRNYFLSIPSTMEEAAKIDGANNVRIFCQMYLPTSKPIIATIVLFTAVSFWNQWSASMLYTDSLHRNLLPLTAILREIIQESTGPSGGGATSSVTEAVKMATVVVATLPIIIVYPFLQKYFVDGIMLGAVKG